MTASPVSVGPSTVVGFGVGGVAFVEAFVNIALGGSSADDMATVVQGVMGGLLLIATVLGRHYQAGKHVEAAAGVEAAKIHTATTGGLLAVSSGSLQPPSTLLEGEPTDPSREFPGGSVPTGYGPEAVDRLRP